ncbi:MAG: LysM peptidoglycan-binding domain-containing protein [Anaerolineales bacterium]|jgi:LysM repeat protein|nr:LysM peptidoglycan-binding domain-containing protein [Anaerolineales bacterium]
MGDWKQLGNGFLLGILSVGLVLGGFSLAMAEDGRIPALAPQASPTRLAETAFPTLELLQPPNDLTQALEAAFTATETSTLPPPPTTCLPPAGWIAISVQPYDTLGSLAQFYRVAELRLQQANCLVSNELAAGSILYVPPLPANPTIACGPPFGWIIYIVQPGDSLFRIGALYRVSISQLQQANCLGVSSNIYSGQKLYVPNVLTSTATFTPLTPATSTPTASPFTLTPSLTAGPSLSPTSVITATETPLLTETASPGASSPTPENTFTATATPPAPSPTP